MSGRPGEAGLHLDEATGEMVSKNELKKRQKQRERAQEKAAKAAAAGGGQESADAASKVYYDARCREIDSMKSQGRSPYVYKVHVTKSVEDFREAYQGLDTIADNGSVDYTVVESLSGRVMSIRRSGQTLVFLVIEEMGHQVQVFCSKDVNQELLGKKLSFKNPVEPNMNTLTVENVQKSSNYAALTGQVFDYFSTLEQINRGDVINVTGCPMRTKTGELSMQPTQIILTAPCLHMLPKQNQKVTDIEARYLNRSVDLFFNRKAQVLLRRVRLIQFIKDFFINKYHFLEVETPILHPIKGGANAKPFVTHYNDLGQDVYLRIAPELYLKQLVIGGLNRVFEMNRNFRNESIDQTHLPEFTMVESYCAHWDLYDQMVFVEDLLSSLAKYANVSFYGQEDNESNPDLYKIAYTDWNGVQYAIDFRPPFRRLDIVGGLESILSEKLGEKVEIPRPYGGEVANKYLRQLVLEKLPATVGGELPAEPYTTARLLDYLVGEFLERLTPNPVFLLHHPAAMSPLAKPGRTDPEVAERFEVFCAMFELANAYTELNDPTVQRANFQAQARDRAAGDDEAQDVDEGFLRAMEHGMVPQSGLGIGIDRLVMLLTGERSIRECVAFPPVRRRRDDAGAPKAPAAE